MQLNLFNQKMDHLLTTKDLIDRYHIRVVHFFNKTFPEGGCTVAYMPEIYDNTGYPKGKFARVSVAWCNPKDIYNRKTGEAIAVDLLLSGDNIIMPIYKHGHPVRALRQIFYDTLLLHSYDLDYSDW